MPHRITCYSRAYFTNIPNHKIVYAVKNIVKEESIYLWKADEFA